MRLMEGRRQVRQFPRPAQTQEAAEAIAGELPAVPAAPAVASPESETFPEECVDRGAVPETFGEGIAKPDADAAESAPSGE